MPATAIQEPRHVPSSGHSFTPDQNSQNGYWNPGPETAKELCKLQLLHGAATAGGILSRMFGRIAAPGFGILTYHRISPRLCSATTPSINVTPAAFKRQLTGLQRRGFEFVSTDRILNALTSGTELPERTVALTFDDIYDNVYLNAMPVLQELGIPCTVFISTAFVDCERPFPFDGWARQNQSQVYASAWRPVTSRHLELMLETGLVSIGAHTHTHEDFRGRPAAFAEDVERGMDILQSRYGVRSLPFAFPYGSPRLGFCNERLMDAVRRLGLTCGMTTGPRTNAANESPFGWGRFHVFDHDTATSLAGKLDGWYEWLPRLKNRFAAAESKLEVSQ